MGSDGQSKASAFSYRVVLPVVIAVGITVATVAGFVLWAAAKSDDRALQRETHIASRVIKQEVDELAAHQDYNSAWDEAVTALGKGDIDWIDAELAAGVYADAAFDRIYVLSHEAAPLYAMYGGGRTQPERFEADRATVAPMVERLKAIGAEGALAAYDAGNSETVPHVSEIGVVDGKPAFIGLTAIMSESGEDEFKIEPGDENFLVAIRYLDGALSEDFSAQYFIEAPLFSTVAATETDRANLALTNTAGETVGWFNWRPDRPGATMLTETLPSMLGALAIAALVLLLLLRSLKRTTSALEAGRVDAEYRANHDVLTGLANRAYFNRELDQALANPPRDGASIALLALDLDRFKQVNDTLGHEAGDQLLAEVARRLKPLVSGNDIVARLGGDEFAILQRGVRSADAVGALSARIIDELGTPFVVTGKVAEIGVSIGIVVAPPAKAARELASKADIALYAAKASGRNTFRIFDDAMEKAADERETVIGEMRAAGLPVGRAA